MASRCVLSPLLANSRLCWSLQRSIQPRGTEYTPSSRCILSTKTYTRTRTHKQTQTGGQARGKEAHGVLRGVSQHRSSDSLSLHIPQSLITATKLHTRAGSRVRAESEGRGWRPQRRTTPTTDAVYCAHGPQEPRRSPRSSLPFFSKGRASLRQRVNSHLSFLLFAPLDAAHVYTDT